MGINLNIYNAILFNIAWIVCVLGGDTFAVFTLIALLYMHVRHISGDVKELLVAFFLMLVGVIVDTALMNTGVMVLTDSESIFPPLWLLCLWGAFATTLNYCMSWFHSRLLLASVLGGVAGAGSYIAGIRLSSFEASYSPMVTFAILCVCWMLIFPFCLWLARTIKFYKAKGFEPTDKLRFL